MTDDTPRISDYRRRLWVWTAAARCAEVNTLLHDLNNGDLYDPDNLEYREGGLAGWSMTDRQYDEFMTLTAALRLTGDMVIYPDRHGCIDSTGREMTGGQWRTRKSRQDVEADRNATRKEENEPQV